jgi:preprotein translocase subunit SecA
VVEQYVIGATEGFAEDWDLEQLWTSMRTLYPVSLNLADYEDREDLDRQLLVDDFKADAQAAYDKREEALGAEVMRELERRVLLTVLDRKWREHLYEMDYLREGIGLRAMAQRDPLVEYQREGSDMFNVMMDAFMEEVVGFVFHLEVEVEQAPQVGVVTGGDGLPLQIGAAAATNGHGRDSHLIESGPDPDGTGIEVHAVGEDAEAAALAEEMTEVLDDAQLAQLELAEQQREAPRPRVSAKGLDGSASRRQLNYSAPDETGSVKTAAGDREADAGDLYAGVGRNAPCPCGSGKKFKMCHGRPGANS